MKKKFFVSLALLTAPFALLVSGEEVKKETLKEEVEQKPDIAKVSKAFGHMLGHNLASLGLDFDMKEVIQGLQDCVNGLDSPMSESECIKAITVIQENAFQKQSLENLRMAEEFLSKNKLAEGVIELEPGKLQYVCLQKGDGLAVEAHFSPVVRYIGKFLDGKVFGESKQDEVFPLEDTIPGLKKAIVGMKAGEKRRIFIHPELAYGASSGYLPPNSLLTFEIEVLQTNAQKADDNSLSATMDHESFLNELATSDEKSSSVR